VGPYAAARFLRALMADRLRFRTVQGQQLLGAGMRGADGGGDGPRRFPVKRAPRPTRLKES